MRAPSCGGAGVVLLALRSAAVSSGEILAIFLNACSPALGAFDGVAFAAESSANS